MNLHINHYTNYQTWEKKKVFDEYPLYIRKNNYTVTLFFKDEDAINDLIDVLQQTLYEIEDQKWFDSLDKYNNHKSKSNSSSER